VNTFPVRPAGPIRDEIAIPGDKSITHRALILASLAEGESTITGASRGDDCVRTARALAAMGVAITGIGETDLRVAGAGLRGLREPADVLDAGNSGTCLRLLAGVLAGQPFFSVLTGDASLRRRPMRRVTEPLARMGATILGRDGGGLPPLAIRGCALRGLGHRLAVASAQVKTALLLAGLFAEGETTVGEPARSRDHTERMLRFCGQPVAREGGTVRLTPAGRLAARAFPIPGDLSSAAFFVVAALLVPGSRLLLRNVGVNPTRTGLLDALGAMGAAISLREPREAAGEPVADLEVTASPLRGVEVAGDLVPRLIDEVPILAVAAACATGRTVIRDAAELRVKESDRIAAVAQELRKLGAEVEERQDGLVIEGGRGLRGAACASHGDHRIAMSLAVAGLVARGETRVADVACIDTSFPEFPALLARLAPGATGGAGAEPPWGGAR
jgi:3-phosphoshikimate 1-carboxyvinyltransferase